jgi:hypothetical protein
MLLAFRGRILPYPVRFLPGPEKRFLLFLDKMLDI